ncbi:Tetratricopeptide TPR_2 repeat-containing protein [Emticicia oligotrophica DSM 17448]|uniref:Tetratricopeptide TPR_2 repeat-containing protein n=1 Tax=Emticicia oligotrophica (strain DSM 17448 / CIP 109782 / MTCC 6937 / GPTSA100-15) TaxID=929562 RepID=A0ABN4AKZ0_EMTOG|nr:tetratricopeptide repeat protein [Emticicia oligotrophica]AFK02970.1 Tetratricopeptide TPR_2 repeat-containing protein [Emticicia oligotrophica DSM 17448]
MAKKEKSGLEIIESPEALQQEFNKAEGFLKNNQKLLTIIGGGILAVVLGVVGYNYYTNSQDDEAQAAMFNAVYAFEADSLKQALNGTGGNEGLLAIADNYGSTKAGKLANFYAGVALVKQGKYDEAIEHLKDFSSDDLLVQARAYALIGDAYMEKKSVDDAISYYKKAADYKPNKTFTPIYLMKLANAYEVAKNNKEALEVYSDIITNYPESIEIGNAKKYKSKLEGTVGE